MKTKLSPRFLCALTLFSLFGQIAWVVENMYLNIFIYNVFRADAADISLMVAASAVSAALTTIFIGSLSDRIGKRKLFIAGGYILWGISIFGFALSMAVTSMALGVMLVIALDCLMTFFGSSANDAAFNAWLTDSTDHTNRGSAEGINAMMPLCAILAVFGGFMAFDLEKAESWRLIFIIIGSVVLAVGILGLFLIKEPENIKKSDTGYWSNILYGFRPATVKAHPSLYLALFLFVIFNVSIQIFMPYLILYYEKALLMTDYVFVMAPAIVLASVVTVFWGRVYDKKGFFFSVTPPLLWLGAGYLLLYFFRATPWVFAGSLLMMCGYLSGMAVFGALVRDKTPAHRAGSLQGVRICSQVLLPGIIGPAIGAAVLSGAREQLNADGTTSFIPNENIFLSALLPILLLSLLLLAAYLRRPVRTVRLCTPFEESASGDEWERTHPRPSCKRESFLPLSGTWQLFVKKGSREEPLGRIRVPFPPESPLSGIGRALQKNETYLYTRTFELSACASDERLLLHFGAADTHARVCVNGREAGCHAGGYLPFTLDVTALVRVGQNTLTVEISDQLDPVYPYGKQRKKRGGMWYTPISGLWQPVWLERVPEQYIKELRVTPTLTSVTLATAGGVPEKKLTVRTGTGDLVRTYTGDVFTLALPDPILWTPEHPYLYEFTLECGKDKIESYFALRTVGVCERNGRPLLTLNGSPYFFHGLLDQGYFPDGIYLPATPEGYRNDILQMKACGFNTLRKHIKIEPDVFYYECDRLGMLVFQDMVNNGHYSFLADTALPTVGLKKGIRHRATRAQKERFEEDAAHTVDLLYNHPSVVYYTIFNEGWGQYEDGGRIYQDLKAQDPTRIYDTASGWFAPSASDVQSEHIYFKRLALSHGALPLVLSEFGGYSCKMEGHSFNLDKTYGYRTCETPAALEKDLTALYLDEVVPAIERGLAAAILTQVSDVEDETNGLLTYDRQILKVRPDAMTRIARALREAYEKANQ